MQTQIPPTVSELVRTDYRLADVFKKWGINYCCGGNRALDEVCRVQGLDLLKVEYDMQQAQQAIPLLNTMAFDTWPADFLADYMVYVHHAYIKTAGPKLQDSVAQFAAGHKQKYPYLISIAEVFKKLVAALSEQVQHEEAVLFPYIKQLHNALKRKESYGPLFVRTLHKSLAGTTGKAHQQTVSLIDTLRGATQHYRFSKEACTNHQVLYHKLKEWDENLMQHIHLEHGILFPKVVQMETELLQL